MRVLLEATAGSRPGSDRGIGRYLSALRAANAALGNDLVELVGPITDGRLAEMSASVRRSLALSRQEYDIFHSPTAYYSAVDLRRRPMAVSILDVIPLDVRAHRRTGIKAKIMHRLAARADVILTLSNHAAGRIEAVLGVSRQRIVVAPLPPAPAFVSVGETYSGVRHPYVAMLADLRTADPRKRTNWIPSVCGHLNSNGIASVVVGAGSGELHLPGVLGLGRVDDLTWACVLRGAEALVYTSAYEGQGLPPLEAIACGTPVVGMANTALPEVVGAAGILLNDSADEGGAAALASQVVRFIEDSSLKDRLGAECAGQASRYTVDRFVSAVSGAYEIAIR